MTARRRLALTLLVGGLLVGPAGADAPPGSPVSAETLEELKEIIQALQARIANLEETLAVRGSAASPPPASGTTDPVPVPVPVSASEGERVYVPDYIAPEETPRLRYGSEQTFVELHGFVDLEYRDAGPDEFVPEEHEEAGAEPGVSDFNNHHATLFLLAQITEQLLVDIEFEYEHGGNETEIDRAEIIWRLADALQLHFGYFFQPFGIEHHVSYSPRNRLVSRPMAMRRIIPGAWVDTGIMARGRTPGGHLNYAVSIANGLGEDAAEADERRESRQRRDGNNNRTVVGRLGISPARGLEFGSSFSTGTYDDEGRRIEFLGFDVAWALRNFELRGEYVMSDVESEDGGYEQDGYYLQAAQRFFKKSRKMNYLDLVARYGAIDLDDTVTDEGDKKRLALGLTLSPVKHFRIKTEYQFNKETGGLSLDDDSWLAQVVVDF